MRSLFLLPLVGAALSACQLGGLGSSASVPDDVVGPFTGVTHRYVVDRWTLPAARTDFSDDLDGDGRPDNQLGNIAGALASYHDDAGAQLPDLVASGALAAVVEIVAGDTALQADPRVGITWTGVPGMPAAPLGGAFVGGRFRSNRTRFTKHPIDATLTLPLFTDSRPISIPLTGIEMDLDPDGVGGFDGTLRGVVPVGRFDLAAAAFPAVAEMLAADSLDHATFITIFDSNSDGKVTLDEFKTNSLVANVLAPDVRVFNAGAWAPAGGSQDHPRDGLSVALRFHLIVSDTIANARKDGDESDVDCGGHAPSCGIGRACGTRLDCASGACVAGRCAPLFRSASAVASPGMGSSALIAADLDGDGKRDLVAAGAYGIVLLVGHGDGTFGAPRTIASGITTSLVSGDFDRDGKLDLAATVNGNLQVLLAAATSKPLSFKTLGPADRVIAADLDGDGKLDLAASAASTPNVTLYHGDGAGGFAPESFAVATRPPLPDPTTLAAADLDGDGIADLAIASWDTDPAGRVQLRLRVRRGGPVTAIADLDALPLLQSSGFVDGVGPIALAAADLDGDGRPDLMLPAVPATYLGGTRRLAGFDGGQNPAAIAIADLDGDGRPDAAVVGLGYSSVSVRMGRGDGSFRPPLRYATRAGASAVVAADLDGDGKIDLAIADRGAPDIVILWSAR